MDVKQKLNRADALSLLARGLTAGLGHGQECGCTGWQAAWCPIHGDCWCNTTLVLPVVVACPLHGEELPFRLSDAQRTAINDGIDEAVAYVMQRAHPRPPSWWQGDH
jgi:hypothetical protein